MSSNIANTVAYLRTSRDFQKDPETLVRDVSKAYIDTANAVNVRTIGIFSTNKSSINGESWYLTSQKQQGFRQIYAFTSFASIPHGLDLTEIDRFVRLFGAYTDGTNWYGILGGTNVALAGQVVFYIDQMSIVFLSAGAPPVTRGTVVIEWLSVV